MAHSEAATLDAIRDCRDQILAICSPLDASGWHTATALPGWDVQDVVAHLGSLDGLLLGREDPGSATDADADDVPAHVRNELGELNERLVARRRSWTPAAVLEEFRATSGERLDRLAALSEDDLEIEVPAPGGGTVPQRRFLGIRLWDFAVHEADIADALGFEPRMDSPSASRVLDELAFLVPRALGRSAAPEGSSIRIDLQPGGRVMAATVDNGRGVFADVAAGEATLHLRASPTDLLRVATGREAAAAAVARGAVTVRGDAHLAATVLDLLNVVP